MRTFIAATVLAFAPVTVAVVAVPAQAHVVHVHTVPDMRDTNWPCAAC